MKYCHKCGQQLPDNAMFCSKCGTKQVSVAPEAPRQESPRPATRRQSSSQPAKVDTTKTMFDDEMIRQFEEKEKEQKAKEAPQVEAPKEEPKSAPVPEVKPEPAPQPEPKPVIEQPKVEEPQPEPIVEQPKAEDIKEEPATKEFQVEEVLEETKEQPKKEPQPKSKNKFLGFILFDNQIRNSIIFLGGLFAFCLLFWILSGAKVNVHVVLKFFFPFSLSFILFGRIAAVTVLEIVKNRFKNLFNIVAEGVFVTMHFLLVILNFIYLFLS